MRNYDLDFLKKFSMVIGFLMALTVILIVFAHHLQGTLVPEQDPSVAKKQLNRIAPAGEVYAGQTGAAAQAAAVAAAASNAGRHARRPEIPTREPDRRKMARPEGFEPPTNGFGSHYSIRLSYGRIAMDAPRNRGGAHSRMIGRSGASGRALARLPQ